MSNYSDRIKPDQYAIRTYLENLRRGRYQIPTFQREVVWERERIKRLWDSIYKFYPLGSILVWRTDTYLQRHREVGGHALPDDKRRHDFQYILDGQQRTTALLTAVYGCGGRWGDDAPDPTLLYVDLTVELDDEGDEDNSWVQRFLFWDEIDDRNGELRRNSGRQRRFYDGLIVSLRDISDDYARLERELVGAGHVDYDDPARERLRRFKQVFDNYKLAFIELRGIEVGEVCQIFERINQAGQPLNIFDIVVAKTFRPEGDGEAGFYLRGRVDAFRQELRAAASQYANVDEQTILQTLAVLVNEYIPNSEVRNITDTYLNRLRTAELEEVWDDATTALKKVFDFLYNHLGVVGPKLVPYRYFYMTMASYFFRNNTPDYNLLKSYFWYYSFHEDDQLRNTTHLRQHVVKFRRAREGEAFGFGPLRIDRARLRGTTYSSKGRLSRAMLALYACQDPRDWALPDRSVLTDVYFQLLDQPNLHHIFPKNFCQSHLSGEACEHADSLLNIAYLTKITNLKIGNQSPADYMQTYVANFPRFAASHLLPENLKTWALLGELPPDALSTFVEARLDLVLNTLGSLVSETTLEVIDTERESSEVIARAVS